MSRLRRAAPLALTATLVLCGTAPVSAAGWTAPQQLTTVRASSWTDAPSIAIRAGKLSIAVTTDAGIFLLTDSSGAWGRSRVTTHHGGEPSLAVDRQGRHHIAFVTFYGIFYATDRSGSWIVTRVHRATTSMQYDWEDSQPSLALTPAGEPVIAFVSTDRILLAHHTAAGWSARRVSGGASDGETPCIAVRGSRTYLVYRRGSDNQLTTTLRLLEIEGGTVVRRSTVTDNEHALNPVIAVDATGGLHVAFAHWGKGLWYGRRDAAGTWTIRRIAPRVAYEFRPSIAMVGSGHVAIVAERGHALAGAAGGSGEILFRTNASGDWTGRLLTHGTRDHAPAIAADGHGSLSVVFLHGKSLPTVWLTTHL